LIGFAEKQNLLPLTKTVNQFPVYSAMCSVSQKRPQLTWQETFYFCQTWVGNIFLFKILLLKKIKKSVWV